jgi:oligoendopeptidase F
METAMTRKKILERKDIPAADRWNLEPLFSSDEDWEMLFRAAESDLKRYEAYKGRLAESAAVLAEAIAAHLDVMRRIETLYTYAHLKSDEDKSNQLYLGMHQRALGLSARATEAASFITPEIQAIPADTMDCFLRQALLKEYRFYLEKILRYRPHTRSVSEEKILAMSREMANAPFQAFGQLDNVDLDFGVLTDDQGVEVELSHGNFLTCLTSTDRSLRRRAFFQYYQAYAAHRNTLASILAGSIRKDVFYARARNFKSCRASGLFADNVPEAVYDNLVTTVRENLKPLFDYFGCRRQILGLPELHMYDTFVPLVRDIELRLSYEEAVDLCVRALRPLGEEYATILKQGLVGGWVDRYENRGKRSGAYASGCYDSPPYILLNYDENTISSLYTLAHEAGHAMHSYYSRQRQPYVDHEYTIFAAEVASTFNEALLTRHLLEYYKDDRRMTRYILNREIDTIRTTLFRQTMFAEFELILHRMAEENRALTLEAMTTAYRSLLEAYFGGAMVLDDVLSLECLRIPHFYSAFYVYQYATGISAALALAEKATGGNPVARERYLTFLSMGGSKFPLEALLYAGVDMRTPEPVERAVAYFAGLVGQLAGSGDD